MLATPRKQHASPASLYAVLPNVISKHMRSITAHEYSLCQVTLPNQVLLDHESGTYLWMQVFDECHHTQNNHPFNKVALKYRQLTHQQQSCLQVSYSVTAVHDQLWPAA